MELTTTPEEPPLYPLTLSEAALTLFRLHIERRGQITVDAGNRETYRELARAGLMVAVSTYAGGPESAYRLTKDGFERKGELSARTKEAG
jgi:hypothetical protein